MLAAFLKLLMPVIIVLPGIAAVVLVPDLARPDEAYPSLMAMLPTASRAWCSRRWSRRSSRRSAPRSIRSRPSSRWTCITPLRPETEQRSWCSSAASSRWCRCSSRSSSAKPLLGSFDQAFQYIQEFTGFFTPGICVIFLLGMFWDRTTATAAMVAMLAAVVMSWVFYKSAGLSVHGSRGLVLPRGHRDRCRDLADDAEVRGRDARRHHEHRLQDQHGIQRRRADHRRDPRGDFYTWW